MWLLILLCVFCPTIVLAARPAPAMEWHRGQGTPGGDHIHHGAQTSDGGYIMMGQTWTEARGTDMLVVKTDAHGDLEWQRVVGEPRVHDHGTYVVEVSDGFVVAGSLT